MKLKLKFITNIFILGIIDTGLLIGVYRLYQNFDLMDFAILLVAFGVGIFIVFETLRMFKQLQLQRDIENYNYEEHSYCADCGESIYNCICNIHECFDDICNGDCGPNCCSVTGGSCCKDKE